MTLAERITRWRESRSGLTKNKLAKAIGVTRQAVGCWEHGSCSPTQDHLEQIAAAIGVSMSVFWGEPPARSRARAA